MIYVQGSVYLLGMPTDRADTALHVEEFLYFTLTNAILTKATDICIPRRRPTPVGAAISRIAPLLVAWVA